MVTQPYPTLSQPNQRILKTGPDDSEERIQWTWANHFHHTSYQHRSDQRPRNFNNIPGSLRVEVPESREKMEGSSI